MNLNLGREGGVELSFVVAQILKQNNVLSSEKLLPQLAHMFWKTSAFKVQNGLCNVFIKLVKKRILNVMVVESLLYVNLVYMYCSVVL